MKNEPVYQNVPEVFLHTPSFFKPFAGNIDTKLIPERFELSAEKAPHPLCLLAATDLQQYLKTQKDWEHNFGIAPSAQGPVIGKMFGVLVVHTTNHQLGYIAAFSGKMAGTNDHQKFVPPVYDLLAHNGFLTEGMEALTQMNINIQTLEKSGIENTAAEIKLLKAERKNHSVLLQRKIFEQYTFLNKSGESKGLFELFTEPHYKNPPSGAGECAAPKLLQYAFLHRLKPLALAEFWWGQSPKSATWKHSEFYPCCKEKCEPILTHMLKGINA